MNQNIKSLVACVSLIVQIECKSEAWIYLSSVFCRIRRIVWNNKNNQRLEEETF